MVIDFKPLSAAAAVLFLLRVAAPPNASGAIWHVSTKGSDSAKGTSAAPLRHLQTALDKARYGDTIFVHPGTYREQVFVGQDLPGNGSATNMLTIQAWNPKARPTINGYQLLTHWRALTNRTIWSQLTGGIPYRPNTIYWETWSVNATTNQAFNLIADSDTTALLPAALQKYFDCDHPVSLANMTNGTFHYDYANHVLYVWRNDTRHAPGPDFPIQAPLLDPSAGPFWGGGSPFSVNASWVHVKDMKFRYGNNVNNPNQNEYPAFVNAFFYSVLEHCDIEWLAYAGVFSLGPSVVTNCVISNNGSTGLLIQGTNEIVTGCVFSNNNFMLYQGGCRNEGALHVQNGAANYDGTNLVGTVISNNTFINNWGTSIHLDTACGAPSNLCLIVNNLFVGTNTLARAGFSANCSGIDLELSSYVGIFNNIFFVTGNTAVLSDGGNCNVIANNTSYASGVSVVPEPYRGGGFTSTNNIVANNILTTIFDNGVIAAGQDSTNALAGLSATSYNNVYANNLLWYYLPDAKLDYRAPWFDILMAPTYSSLSVSTNLDAWAQIISGSDPPSFQNNAGNFLANPLFHNPANSADPTKASYYLLASNSPAILNATTNHYGVAYDFLGHRRGIYSCLGAYQSRGAAPRLAAPPMLISVGAGAQVVGSGGATK